MLEVSYLEDSKDAKGCVFLLLFLLSFDYYKTFFVNMIVLFRFYTSSQAYSSLILPRFVYRKRCLC